MDDLLISDVCDEGCDCLETDDDDNSCLGHETLRGDKMGESFYCDGSCISD